MRRALVVAFAVVGSVLVASASVGAAPAAPNLAVGSQHTTAGELRQGTLTNASVQGGGEDAYVSLFTVDQFEDGNTTIERDGIDGWFSDSLSVQSGTTISGEQSGRLTAANDFVEADFDTDTDQTTNFSTKIQIDSQTGSNEASARVRLINGSGNNDATLNYSIGWVDFVGTGDVEVNHGGGTTTVQSWSAGTTYDVKFSFDFAADQFYVHIDGTRYGPYNNNNPASGWAQVNIDSDSRTSTATVNTYIDDVRIAGQSGTYVSPSHTVSNAQQAAINITKLSDVSVNATVRTDGGTVLNQTTMTSTGNHSLALADTSSSKLETELNVTVTGSDPVLSMADETILFDNAAPTASNLDPPGGTNLTGSDVGFSVEVNDSQFGTSQGDSVTAELFVDGSSVGSKTVTSNGTVTISHTLSTGGAHDYKWVLTDSYGATTDTGNQTIRVPATLEIRNESDPDSLVDNAEVELQFYASDDVVTKSTTNGQIDLTGLPVDERMVVVANAQNYSSRNVILDGIYQQDSVYLLPENETSVTVRFLLTDNTGQFPNDNSTIYLERALNRSGNTEWRIIAGDTPGVDGFTTEVKQDTRYRITVESPEGQRRVLGSYSATADETIELEVGALEFDVGNGTKSYLYNATYGSTGGDSVRFNYSDIQDNTSSLTVKIYERGNESNEIYNNTFTDLGTAAVTQPTNGNVSAWVVEFEGTRDGNEISGRLVVGPGTDGPNVPIDKKWKGLLSVGVVMVLGGLFGGVRGELGAIVVSLVSGVFFLVGWMPAEVTGAFVIVALLVAILFAARGSTGVPE